MDLTINVFVWHTVFLIPPKKIVPKSKSSYNQENPIIMKFLAHSRYLISDIFFSFFSTISPIGTEENKQYYSPWLIGGMIRKIWSQKKLQVFEVMAKSIYAPSQARTIIGSIPAVHVAHIPIVQPTVSSIQFLKHCCHGNPKINKVLLCPEGGYWLNVNGM